MIGTITQYGIFTLLGAAIILLLSFVVENGIKQVDDMLVPCQHGTPFIQGKCRCDGSPFNGTFCSNCMCEYGSCSLEPTTPFPENDFGCRCPTQMKRFGYFCDLCNTIDANESCKGDCKPDFFGPKCERICYANLDFTNDNSVCNLMRSNGGHCSTCHGHGTCEDGFCECDDNYFNDGRDECVKTCPVSANGQICSGHGNCKLFGNTPACVCEDGWNGITCNIPCPGIEEAGLSCFGHGICNVDFDAETATCDCNQKFRGLDCSIECPGEVVACNGHGTCDDVGMCICQTNVQWSVPSCKCSDELTCNGRGTCTAGEFCACFGNFAGEHCLECKKNWHGEECDLYCDPYLKVNVSDKLENQWGCFGHGTCLERSGKMECTCNLDTTITLNLGGAINDYNSYYDPEMNCGECLSEYFPKQKIVNDHGLPSDYTVPCEGSCNPATCNNRGTCNHNYGIPGENLCACDIPHLSDESFCTSCEENWYPLDFSRDNFCNKFCIASGELPSECDGTIDCVQCNGHGTCSDDAECLCTDGYSGDRCQIYCASDNGVVCGGHGTCESNEIQQLMEHEFEKEGGIATYSCTCDPQDPVDADSRIDWDEKLAQGLVNGTLDPPPDPEFFGETCDYSCVKPPWEASDECNGLGNCSVVTIRDPTDLHIPCFKDSDCTDSTTITQILSGDATWSNTKGPFCHKTDDILGCDKSTDDCYEILLHHRPRKMRSEDCIVGDGFTEVTSGPAVESPFKEVITGPNDNMITEQECDDYAMAAGLYFSTQTSGSRPTGCWLYNTPSPHQIYYNYAPTGGDCSSLQPCLQKRTRVEVTVGPPDLSLSQVECEAYGRDTSGLYWYSALDQAYRPKGCIRINVNQIYYNTGTSSTVECDTTNNAHVSCIQKYDASVYVSKTECQEYADSVGETFIHVNNENQLPGCFNPSNANVIYNSNFDNNINSDCSGTPCIQKTSCFSALESLDWHNYCENVMEKEQPDLFSSCKSVASLCKPLKYAPGDMYAEDSGAPDLSLTRKECLDYATSIDSVGATFETTTNGYPSGCIKQIVGGSNFNKINYNTGTGDCSHVNVNCIQKRDICMPMVHMTDGIDVSYKLNLTYEYDKRQYPFLISNEYRTTMGALEHDEAEAYFSDFAHDVDMKLPTDFCSKHKTRYPEFNSVRENKQYLCNGLIVDTKTCDGVLSESANNFYNPFTVECPNSVETFSTYQDAVLNREYGCKIVETQKDHVFIDNKEEMGRLHVDSVCDHITNKFPSCKYPSPCDFNPCLDGYGCANSGTKAICSTTGNINSTCLKGTMERLSYTSYSCDIVVPDTTCPIDNTFNTNVAQHCIDNNPIVSHVETIGENENKALTGAKYIHFEFKAEDLVSTSTRLEFLSGTTDVVTIYVRQGQIQLNEVELLQACPLTNQQCNDAWAYEPDIWYHIELEISATTVKMTRKDTGISLERDLLSQNTITNVETVSGSGIATYRRIVSETDIPSPYSCTYETCDLDVSYREICSDIIRNVEYPSLVLSVKEVTSGAPDMSLSEDECKAYYDQNDGYNSWMIIDSANVATGCLIGTTSMRWNTNINVNSCGSNAYDCLQKPTVLDTCSTLYENTRLPLDESFIITDEAYGLNWEKYCTFYDALQPANVLTPTPVDTGKPELSWIPIEVASGAVAESPYYEQTSGAPDLSVSQSECEAYGLSMGDSDGLSLLTNGYPAGCFKRTSGYFYSTGTDGTQCTTTNTCIQKNPSAYVSESQCKEHADQNDYIWATHTQPYRPAGCWMQSASPTSYIYWNYATDEQTCDTGPCIQSAGDNPAYMTEPECEEYMGSGWSSDTYSTDRPTGCYVSGGAIYFNHQETNVDCSAYTCIKKLPEPLLLGIKEVTSGVPKSSMTKSECQSYADPSKWGGIVNWSSDPSGCIIQSDNSIIRWNENVNANQCNTIYKCLQQKTYENLERYPECIDFVDPLDGSKQCIEDALAYDWTTSCAALNDAKIPQTLKDSCPNTCYNHLLDVEDDFCSDRAEIFTSNTDVIDTCDTDWYNYCLDDAKGTLEGKCSAVECTCDYESYEGISGEACELHCPLAFDGSACAEVSGMGKCVYTPAQKTFMANGGVFDPVWAIEGECQCFIGEGTRNCDIECRGCNNGTYADRYITSGSGQPDDEITEEICKEYADSIDTVTNTNLLQSYGNNRPSGCFRDIPNNYVYFNTDVSSTACSNNYPCVVKNPNAGQIGICDNGRGVCDCLPPFTSIDTYTTHDWRGKDISVVERSYGDGGATGSELYRIRQMQGKESFVKNMLQEISINNEITFTATTNHYVYNGQNDPDINVCRGVQYKINVPNGHDMRIIPEANCQNKGCNEGEWLELPVGERDLQLDDAHVFLSDGLYFYVCKNHPKMVGKFIVTTCSGTPAYDGTKDWKETYNEFLDYPERFWCYDKTCSATDVAMLGNLAGSSSRYNFDCNKQCLGFDPDTQLSCNGNGYCGAIGECICDKAKILKNVPDPPVQKYQVIPGIEITDTKYEPSSLERTGFRGEACDTICPGYDPLIGDMNSICNGHGVCDLSGMCACDLGYTGDECQFTCPVDEGNICNGHGTCEMAEVRVQLDIYDGFSSSCVHFADVDNCNAYAILNDLEIVNIAHTKVVGENAACKRISEAECEAWGNFQEVTYTYEGRQDSAGNPSGCYLNRENKLFYNTGGQTDNCGSNNKLCICETEIPDTVYCSLDNNKVVIHTKGGKPYTNKKGLYDMEVGGEVTEVTSGDPDLSVSKGDCVDMTVGGAAWDRGAGMAKGCTKDSNGNINYNTNTASTVQCSTSNKCIQLEKYTYNDAIIKCDRDNCLAIQQNPPASDNYYVLEESKFVRDQFNEGFSPAESCENPRLLGEIPNVVGDEVALKTCLGFCRSANTGGISDSDTGAPNDGSVSRTECEEWAAAQNLWQSQVSWSTYPTGCIRHSNGYFYYNTGGSANCGVYTTKCAQKSTCTTFSLRPGSYAASCFKCDPASDSDVVTKRRYKKRRDGNAEFAIKQTGDADHSVSQSQCEQYAADQGVTVTVSSWSTFHYGCSKYYNTKNYYWNTYGINSNIQCGVANHYCVQLSGQTRMTEEECDDIASLGSGEYEKDSYDDLPKGCLIEGNTIKFNYRSEGKNTAYTANVMGVVKLPNAISTFILTTFGAPNLSLNEAECRKLGSIDGRWGGTSNSASYPKGCFRQNSNDLIYYGTAGTATCTTTYACLEVGAFETYYGPDGNDGSVDELQCEHYAETFAPGMTFSAGSWSSDPAGCYHTLSGTVYFNRQATGRACNTNSNYECIRISPYTKEEFQVVNSGSNANSVAKSECKSFGLRNGFTSFSSVYDNGNYPSYCSVTDGLNIYWNSYTTSSKFCDFSFGCIQDVVSSAYNVDELISGEDYTRYIRNPNSLCIKESALDVESRTQAPVIKSLREYNDKCKYFSATDNCPIKATEEQCNRYANGELFNGFVVTNTNEGSDMPPPFDLISSGIPDLSISQVECEEYLTEITATSMSLIDNPSAPNGCYIAASGALLYYNSNGGNCETGRPCIQKRTHYFNNGALPDLSMSKAECEQYANMKGYSYDANYADNTGIASGCIYDGTYVKYNGAPSTTMKCGTTFRCVEKYTPEVASKYLSFSECAALPDYHTVSTVAGYPYGCIYQTVGGTAQYKYQFNTNLNVGNGNCANTAQNCAQKKPYSKQLRTDRPDGCYMDGSQYKYNEAVVEVDSGAPDMSLSLAECEEYRGSGWSSDTYSTGRPSGCYKVGGVIYFNHEITNIDCTTSVHCIQKGAPQHIWISSGAPSLSLSQTECQEYAGSVGKPWSTAISSQGSDQWENYIKGCQADNTNVYWNPSTSSTIECGHSGNKCIEKPCAAFRCVCASDMYMDETTGICKPISGKPIIKATFIQDRNMDEEKSFQVDCQVVSDTQIECAQCSCFGDFMYGYWAGQTCSTCATGYGKSQCSAVCPDFDGETKKSMCAGFGQCLFGSEKPGLERVFQESSCLCGQEEQYQPRLEDEVPSADYSDAFEQYSWYEPITNGQTYSTLDNAKTICSRYNDITVANLDGYCYGVFKRTNTGGAQFELHMGNTGSEFIIYGLYYKKELLPRQSVSYAIEERDLITKIDTSVPLDCNGDLKIVETGLDVCNHFDMNSETCDTCQEGWTGKNCRAKCQRCLLRGTCKGEPDTELAAKCNCPSGTTGLWEHQCCPAGFRVTDLVKWQSLPQSQIDQIKVQKLYDPYTTNDMDSAFYCKKCPGVFSTDWMESVAAFKVCSGGTRGECIINPENQNLVCECKLNQLTGTTWKGRACSCDDSIDTPYSEIGSAADSTDYGCIIPTNGAAVCPEPNPSGAALLTWKPYMVYAIGRSIDGNYVGTSGSYNKYLGPSTRLSSPLTWSGGIAGEIAVTIGAQGKCDDTTPCHTGEGPCLVDTDCAGGLICNLRFGATLNIPGYDPTRVEPGFKYCYDPQDNLIGCDPIPTFKTFDSNNYYYNYKYWNGQTFVGASPYHYVPMTKDANNNLVIHKRDFPCPKGKYGVVWDGTPECALCPSGYYQDETGKSNCKTGCGGGQVGVIDFAQCVTCPAGKTPSMDFNSCDNCPAGKYEQNNACLSCPKNTYQYGIVSVTSGTTSVSNALSGEACKAYGESLGKWNYEGAWGGDPFGCFLQNNKVYYNRWNTGKACSSSNVCYQTQPITGQYGSNACKACPAGRSTENQIEFTGTCLGCAGGKFNANTESDCGNCPIATYGPGPDENNSPSAACTDCPAGKYNNNQGQSSCSNCGTGKYQDQTKQTNCKDCQAGKYNNQNGRTSCTNCPAGNYQDITGKTSCKTCAVDYYQDQTGQASCKSCLRAPIYGGMNYAREGYSGSDFYSGSGNTYDNCGYCPSAGMTAPGTPFLSYFLEISGKFPVDWHGSRHYRGSISSAGACSLNCYVYDSTFTGFAWSPTCKGGEPGCKDCYCHSRGGLWTIRTCNYNGDNSWKYDIYSQLMCPRQSTYMRSYYDNTLRNECSRI